jgi:hypothetical protein
MNSNNYKSTSPNYKNKKTANKTIPWLIIPKSLLNQMGTNSPSDLSGNENDWQTDPPESTEHIPNRNLSTLEKIHKYFYLLKSFLFYSSS